MKKLTSDQIKGVTGTVLFHVLLLLLLTWLALRTPLPLPGEEGVEVNLGYDKQGYGLKQEDQVKSEQVKKKKAAQEPEKIEKSVNPSENTHRSKETSLTQDTEEAPALKSEKKKKPKTVVKKKKKPVKKPEKVKPVVNERALFKGGQAGRKGQNQGVTQGMGDQGSPHGYKESERYQGTGGEGNGIAYSLGGRGSKFLEKPTVNVTETGSVVVAIWVDPTGKVIRAQVRQKGTTVLDPHLRKMAVEAALNSVFEPDPSAPPEQRGTITYQFILLK